MKGRERERGISPKRGEGSQVIEAKEGMGSAYVVFMWILLLVLSLVALAVFRRSLRDPDPAKNSTPPGPPRLPLVGSLLQLGSQPHRSLASLAKIHGPLMSLHLGRAHVVVVSSPSVAKQVLHTHDHTLSFRAAPDAVRALRHDELSVVWMPPDATWRHLRRLCSAHLFTPQRLDANQVFRSQKMRQLVSFLEKCSKAGQAVDIGRIAFTTTLNLISNTLFSADVVAHESESSTEFKKLVRQVMEEAGSPNIADYFPLLRWADPQGRRRRETVYFGRLHKLFDGLIDSRLKSRSGLARGGAQDFLDVLLDSLASSELDRPTINSLLTDIFCAGSETSSTTVEWAMAELLDSTCAAAKLRCELEEAMKSSSGREMVEESDIDRMPYLQAVVKETLRLHPPVPFLIPRRAAAEVEITTGPTKEGEGAGSYKVPEGATVLVNAWAIGRDPDAWGPEVGSFRPERFLEDGDGAMAGVEFRGWNLELIPFGAGRRICPGMPLAARMVPLTLANLLWSFDWVQPEGMAPGDVNMTDAFGVTLSKAKPLLAIPRRRRAYAS